MERTAARAALWIVIVTIVAVAVLAYLALTRDSHAQPAAPTCMPVAELSRSLAEQYGERLRVQAIRSNGSMLQVYASAGGRTFTIASISVNRVACILDTGEYWTEKGDGA